MDRSRGKRVRTDEQPQVRGKTKGAFAGGAQDGECYVMYFMPSISSDLKENGIVCFRFWRNFLVIANSKMN